MKTIPLLAMIALVSTAGAAAAQTDQDQANHPKKEKQICRSEPVTGSRTKVNRVCMTLEEWNKLAEQTRNSMDSISRDASMATKGSSNPLGGN